MSSLDENDIQLILKQYNSKFITSKIPPGNDTFEDLSEVLSRAFIKEFEIGKLRPNHKHDRPDSIIIDSDSVNLIIKLILRYDIKFLRFDKIIVF